MVGHSSSQKSLPLPPAHLGVADLRLWLAAQLAEGGIPDSALEADIILAWLLGCDQSGLILQHRRVPGEQLLHRLQEVLCRRLGREPLAYIMGEWEFWSLPFKVGPPVLIPRPETELLVEQALEFALQWATRSPAGGEEPMRILDLGSGSGILAVVLARELPEARVVAVDLSPAALELARENARRHRVEGRISFVTSSWLSALAPQCRFDLVVSNPPYVVRGELPRLQPEVRDYEPRSALDGGGDGLDEIREIKETLPPLLEAGGALLMEIGWDQGEAVKLLFEADLRYSQVSVLPDLAGLPRVLRCRRTRYC